MKLTKKLLAAVLALTMLFALAACSGGNNPSSPSPSPSESGTPSASTPVEPSNEPTLPTIEAGKLILSTNSDFPPYDMLADDGSFEGIDYDVAAVLAEKLGLELVINDMGFDAALLAVQNGQSDIVMAGVTVSEDRLLVMDFTDSYATGTQVVIVKEGSEVTMDNLGDYMIGTQLGTTGYIFASDTVENGGYGEDHVIGFEGGATAVQALINGQIDAVIIDDLPAQQYVAANAGAGLTILDGEWVVENYAIGVQKGNTALVEALNEAMAELKADGTFQTIVDKYIKAD